MADPEPEPTTRIVVEYMPEGVDHWLVALGAPGESFADTCAAIRRQWPCPCLFRERGEERALALEWERQGDEDAEREAAFWGSGCD